MKKLAVNILDRDRMELKFDRDRWKEIAEVRYRTIVRQDVELATLRDVRATLIDERIGNVLKGYLIELENNREICAFSLRDEMQAKIQAVEEVIQRLKS